MDNAPEAVAWKLNKNIYSRYGHLLLPSSAVLTDERLRRLRLHNVHLAEGDLVPVSSRSRELIQSAVAEVRTIFEQTRAAGEIPFADVKQRLIPRVERLAIRSGLFPLLIELQEIDDYTYTHNVAVGVISAMIGRWLGLDRRAQAQLIYSACLHDIGKVKIPADILRKPDKLTAAEYDLMKRHTMFGWELIRHAPGGTERMARVALEHHEREDGSGYPNGWRGEDLDPMSKIVAVADVFHAMTSRRAYKPAVPLHLVLKQMIHHAYGRLDPRIVNVFVNKTMTSLVGGTVMLSDGSVATVVMIRPDDPANPLVRSGERFIDLSREPGLNLTHVLS